MEELRLYGVHVSLNFQRNKRRRKSTEDAAFDYGFRSLIYFNQELPEFYGRTVV
jgi:hypothetical protein